MAKQSKRSRKFQASGGVAARLKKGTVTKKGKLQKRSSGASSSNNSSAEKASIRDDEKVVPRRDRSDDLVAPKNVGTLDLDSFFAQVANTLELQGGSVDEDKYEAQQEQEPVVLSYDDDDEFSSKDEEEQQSKKETKAKKKTSTKQKERADEASSSSDDASSSDDNSDDDDDDDIEVAEARMKKEMARLTEKDPEFHEFLQEHEQDLLEFGHDQGEDEEDDEDDDDEEQDEDQMQADVDAVGDHVDIKDKEGSSSSKTLTIVLLDKLRRGTFESHSIKALKKLVAAYRSACYLSDASSDASASKGAQTYAIESPAVFDSLMVLCLSRCHKIFRYHLLGGEKESKNDDEGEEGQENAVDPDQPIQPHKLENSEKWESIQPILQSFLRSTIHLLNESKEPNLLAFITKALAQYLPLMTPFPRLAEALLKTAVNMWSAAADTSADYQVVRLQAFFRIRQLALTQPFPFSETVLKKTYLAYAARAAFGTASSLATTLPTLTFMGNCLVELYGLDYHSSYQHAFVYIRQLALQLRAAVQKKTPEAFQQVYSQQYMHCLKLWTAVLAHATSKEDEDPDAKIMRSLLYPLSEIILGTARTAPSPVRLLPLRLQCIRLLQQLAASAQVYLPTTSLLLDCLDWKEWYAKPKKATKRNTLRGGLPLYMLLKLPKEDPLRTHEQLEAALVQIILCLEREMELYRYTAAFPEFRVRIRQRCRDFIKLVRPSRWKAYARSCIEKSEQYAAFVTQERAKLAQAPKDISVLECLRPSHISTMQERHQKAMDEESKSAQSILAAAASASQAKKRKNVDETDDDEAEEHGEVNASEDEDEAKQEQESPKSKKKNNKTKTKKAKVADPDEVMEQEDEVVEGVDWLD